ncbi:MAG: hypothetical protein V2B14_02020 [bacterium]
MRVASSILAIILIMPFLIAFTPNKDISQNNIYSEVSDNPKIIQALDSLDNTTGEWARKAILGNNISGKPIKIIFKDLSKISAKYKDFDALGWKDKNRLYIYINNKHENAPVEALASLLSHESLHQDEYSSIEEETFAWGYEADVWIQMKIKKPELKNINSNEYSLVDRLNTLEKMFKNANYTTKEIKNAVNSNPGYKDLPLYSPGFEE